MPIKLRQPARRAGKGVIPRVGSSLYTAKDPVRCPHCGGTSLARKGARRKKFETVQRWQCAACGRGFTPAPPELRAKTYPLRVILEAVTLYNLGHRRASNARRSGAVETPEGRPKHFYLEIIKFWMQSPIA